MFCSAKSDTPGPLRTVVNAAADTLSRILHRMGRDRVEIQAKHMAAVIPVAKSIFEMLRAPEPPRDCGGPKVKQVNRELAAEEASLSAEFTKMRAKLVADFGPRFAKADAEDDADLLNFGKSGSK